MWWAVAVWCVGVYGRHGVALQRMELVPLEDAKPDQQLVPFEQPMALVPHVAGWGVPFHFKLAY